ncbi:hypothetical protein, partial [Gordonia terrae]
MPDPSSSASPSPGSAPSAGAPGVSRPDLLRALDDVGLVDADRLRRRIDRLTARPDAAKWEQLVTDVDKARARLDRRRASVPILRFPDELPVSAAREEIAEAIRDHQVVVIAGETGSGKTTQL